MPNIGPTGFIIVLALARHPRPKRLPQAGRSLGQEMRKFKASPTGGSTAEPEQHEAKPVDACAPAVRWR
jgi:sec-independent protein translocase protein TatA